MYIFFFLFFPLLVLFVGYFVHLYLVVVVIYISEQLNSVKLHYRSCGIGNRG